MGCSPTGCKNFLVCSNVALLFNGISILVLGLKMRSLLSVVLLIDVPIIAQAVEAVIATGSLISIAGVTGIVGAFYEVLWLISLHMFSLGIIVVMEFGLGVTLVIVKQTIEIYIVSRDCNKSCATTLDTVVLDYALPAAGLMMTMILVEAVMIYCAIRLYLCVRDTPKTAEPVNTTFIVQNVQMQSVASPIPSYATSSLTPQMYTPQMNFPSQRTTPNLMYRSASPRYVHHSPTFPKLPLSSPSSDQELPPSYVEAAAQLTLRPDATRAAMLNSV